jgi:hypothetical protein
MNNSRGELVPVSIFLFLHVIFVPSPLVLLTLCLLSFCLSLCILFLLFSLVALILPTLDLSLTVQFRYCFHFALSLANLVHCAPNSFLNSCNHLCRGGPLLLFPCLGSHIVVSCAHLSCVILQTTRLQRAKSLRIKVIFFTSSITSNVTHLVCKKCVFLQM